MKIIETQRLKIINNWKKTLKIIVDFWLENEIINANPPSDMWHSFGVLNFHIYILYICKHIINANTEQKVI